RAATTAAGIRGNRADVDDAASRTCQMWRDGYCHQERALEVSVYGLVKVALGLVQRHVGRDADDESRRIDQNVDVAEARNNLRDGGGHLWALADIGTPQAHRRTQRLGRLAQRRLTASQDNDMRAPLRESLRDGAAHAAATASDNRHARVVRGH